MGENLTKKILAKHLTEGELIPGREIAIRVDQTLTQDASGTMVYLQLEAMGIPRVKTELSVSYVDHNTLQTGFENADDHRYLQGIARNYGIYFSRPGNGICHQVHMERFGVPGKILLGSDSHTTTAGGLGMLAVGAGGLDVAAAMAGRPFYLVTPQVVNICLEGTLGPWVSAKDVALEVLRRLSVKGGVGKVLEYTGSGVATLTVPERATITNMSVETGAFTGVFPSDTQTRTFLQAQNRAGDWQPVSADPDAVYDESISVQLDELEPLAACPHSPDRVKTVREEGPVAVDQVVIGACTNSSYLDLMRAAVTLRNRKVHSNVNLVIVPGSRQVLTMLAQNGALADLVNAGARVLETACGPCIGMGQSPPSAGISVRTFNRNFAGRCGTEDAGVYLVSPETAAATAMAGHLADPRTLGEPPAVSLPEKFYIDDGMIIPPSSNEERVQVVRGPNIKPLPEFKPPGETIKGEVLLRIGDNVTTDDIMPAGSKILPLRSNIPAMSEYVFSKLDPTFTKRAKESGGGLIVGGINYGQGSSREHAALVPKYLGVKAVIARSFARIHRDNLINYGILPLKFVDPGDYERMKEGDSLEIKSLADALETDDFVIENLTRGYTFRATGGLTPRQKEIILAGGRLNCRC